MNKVSESSSDTNHFIFFNEYEEDRFEEFVDIILNILGLKEDRRELGPYSVLVTVFYKGYELVLTHGSFEGCFISLKNDGYFLAKNIIETFNAID